MDEATLRFFEELPNSVRSACAWDNSRSNAVMSAINSMLGKYLPLLCYYMIPDGGWELRVGKRAED
jgi:hypothetical protein